MSLDHLDSRSMHLGCCVSIPASFPECAEVSLVHDGLHSKSNDGSAREPLVKAVQRLSPKVTICTFIRPRDICVVYRPPENSLSYDGSQGTWSHGQDVRELLGDKPILASLFVERNASILVQQQIATYAGSDLDLASTHEQTWTAPGGCGGRGSGGC
jgi:hypothetical protein